jgi:hypothetical protein
MPGKRMPSIKNKAQYTKLREEGSERGCRCQAGETFTVGAFLLFYGR